MHFFLNSHRAQTQLKEENPFPSNHTDKISAWIMYLRAWSNCNFPGLLFFNNTVFLQTSVWNIYANALVVSVMEFQHWEVGSEYPQMVPVIWAMISEQNQIIHFILILPWEFLLRSLPVMAQHTCGPAILVTHGGTTGETISIKLWQRIKKVHYYWVTFKFLAYKMTWLRTR